MFVTHSQATPHATSIQSQQSPALAKALADFNSSQLTVPQFCQSIGCSVPTFYHWKRKLQESTQPSAFLSVQTTDPQPACMEVRFPSGITLHIYTSTRRARRHLKKLLQAYALAADLPLAPETLKGANL